MLNLFSSNVALRDHLLFISMLLAGEKIDAPGALDVAVFGFHK